MLPATNPPAPIRVLLVDDEADFLSLTAELLRREGYEVGSASDAAGAFDALATGEWDVVVSDVNMPGNAEMEFVRSCRARFPRVAVLVVTGYPSVDTAAVAVRCAAVDYLVKPVEFARLREAIEEACRKSAVMRLAEQVEEETVGLLRRARALGSALGGPAGGEDVDGDGRAGVLDGARGSVEAELRARLARLTAREREVMTSLMAGRRVQVIAAHLGLSPSTVRNHVKAILRKLGMHSQIELLARVRSLGR